MAKNKKPKKLEYRVCGSRFKDEDFCDKATNQDDLMKEFSCGK